MNFFQIFYKASYTVFTQALCNKSAPAFRAGARGERYREICLRFCFAVWSPCVPGFASHLFLLLPNVLARLVHVTGARHIGFTYVTSWSKTPAILYNRKVRPCRIQYWIRFLANLIYTYIYQHFFSFESRVWLYRICITSKITCRNVQEKHSRISTYLCFTVKLRISIEKSNL